MNRFQEGFVLGDRYTLVTRIASGGMGDVWEATDGVLERQVAVKILRPSMDEEEVFARRFRNEALHTANLAHYNIATVFDYGEEDNLAYLVMELVPGEPLSDARQARGRPRPPSGSGPSWARRPSPSVRRTRPGSSTATSSRPTSSSCPTAR